MSMTAGRQFICAWCLRRYVAQLYKKFVQNLSQYRSSWSSTMHVNMVSTNDGHGTEVFRNKCMAMAHGLSRFHKQHCPVRQHLFLQIIDAKIWNRVLERILPRENRMFTCLGM